MSGDTESKRERKRASSAPADAGAGPGSTPGDERERRPRDREKTIEAILDAAETLVDQKGPDGFGLAELGKSAGVSFGLIHHYFGGKEGLLRAVLRRTLRGMGEELRRVQEDGSFWHREAPAVLVVFQTFTTRPGFARLVSWGLLTGLIRAQDVADEFRTDAEAVGTMIEEFRREAPEVGGGDPAIIATLLMSAVLGFNLLRPLLVETFDWGDAEDEMVRDQLTRAMVELAKSSES